MHVAKKQARRCDKLMMRQLGLEVASGSEDRITDEVVWTWQHCQWTDSEADDQPDAAEESNEHEEY